MEGRYLTKNYSFRISYYSDEIQPFYGSGNVQRSWGGWTKEKNRASSRYHRSDGEREWKKRYPTCFHTMPRPSLKLIFIFLFKPLITEANRSALQRLQEWLFQLIGNVPVCTNNNHCQPFLLVQTGQNLLNPFLAQLFLQPQERVYPDFSILYHIVGQKEMEKLTGLLDTIWR